MARIFYKYTADDIRSLAQYESKKGYEFKQTDSRMVIQTAGNIHAGASFTINFLHLSEVARYKDPEALDTSFFPSVPNHPSSVIMIESTAKGAGAWFQDMWNMAGDPQAKWLRIFIPWYFADDYTQSFRGYGSKAVAVKNKFIASMDEEEKWLRGKLRLSLEQLRWRRTKIIGEFKGDVEKFRQEYPSTPQEAWITAGQLAFDKVKLRAMSKHITQPEIMGNIYSGGKVLRDNAGSLWVWEYPKKEESYDIGADVSEGTPDGAFSTAQVIERKTKRQMAEWRGKIDPIEFAKPLMLLGIMYNNAQIAIETNSMGCATQAKLVEKYYNIYRWRYRDEIVPKMTRKLGWYTTRNSKDYLISTAKHIVYSYNGNPLIRSERLMGELLTFVTDGMGKYYGVSRSNMTDLVMAWLIALTIASDEEEKYDSPRYVKPEKIERPEGALCDRKWEKILSGGGRDNRHWMDL
jgi:hypothetical protein